MPVAARILADSIGPNEARITTFEIVVPRIILAEFNTHRLFSRNSASSRAIPVQTMIEKVRNDPFIPFYWGKNQKGMQADQELTEQEKTAAASEWLLARDQALDRSNALREIGVHKQITNRLLEPFLWHTIIFTATEMSNYIALRTDRMAAPEIRSGSELIMDLYEDSKPMELQDGEWHLPLVMHIDMKLGVDGKRWAIGDTSVDTNEVDWLHWARISAARCARISYLTHDGRRDLEEDTKKCADLISNGHMSPLEHPAMALTASQWRAMANAMAVEWVERRVPVGNFWGWQQFRKTLTNEHDFSKIKKG